MTLKKKSIIYITFAVVLQMVFLAGCPVELGCKILSDKNIAISFSTKAGAELSKLIKGVSDDGTGSQLFNSNEIKDGLETAGLKDVVVSTPDDSTLRASFVVLNKTESGMNSIFSEDASTGKAQFCLTQEIIQDVYNSMDRSLQRYVDMLIAPSVTGDTMTAEEYKELLSSVYGEALTAELLAGNINLTLSNKGKQTKAQISMTNLLTLAQGEKITISF